MHNAHRHSAWLLLLAFVVGGLLAPSVHLLHHAQETGQQRAAEAAQHRGHAHAAPGLEAGVPTFESLVCPPFHHLLAGVHVQHAVVALIRVALPLMPHPAQHLSDALLRHPAIRGPPVLG